MSLDSILQDAARDSASLPSMDKTEPQVRAIVPMAFASKGPRCESAEQGSDLDRTAAGPWVGCCEWSGVVEIHDPRLLRPGLEAFCRALLETAVVGFGASRAEIDLETATCRLEFSPGRFDLAELAGRAAGAIRAATPAVREGSGRRDGDRAGWTVLTAFARDDGASVREGRQDAPDEPICVAFPVEDATRSRRLVNLAMAGGSFALAVGGVIIPGIPTLPFVIMTGRYAVRVSPRIERLLKRQPWCAAMLAEADASAGPKIDWWSLSRMIGLAALFAAAFLILHPPFPVVLVLELGVMAYFAWREMGNKPGRLEFGHAAAA
jgi:uncharacterized membrane protein YbaN (DUF454 family)